MNPRIFRALLSFFLCVKVSLSDLVVQTKSGKIRGVEIRSPNQRLLNGFFGIPFAEPPIGDRRFRHPVEVSPWPGIFNATEPSLACYQKQIFTQNMYPRARQVLHFREYSEDCLTLNIWVPENIQEPLPVLVWISGGGFSRSGPTVPDYDGGTLASEEGIIVASFNYRLAALGFLFLDHPDVPGNAGLFDQRLALKWLKRNIAFFGGDAAKITVDGQSSGSASIGYHLLSPKSKNLFSGAILQSGAPNKLWAFMEPGKSKTLSRKLVRGLGCSLEPMVPMSKTVECLRKVDVASIIALDAQLELDNSVFAHRPTLDGNFFVDYPENLMARGQMNDVDLITGINKDDGTIFTINHNPFAFQMKDEIMVTKNDFLDVVEFQNIGNLTAKIVEWLYPDKNLPPETMYLKASNHFVTDTNFVCPVALLEKTHMASNRKPLFSYYFTHRSSTSTWPRWTGTVHGEEIAYVFGRPLDPELNFTDEEISFSRRIMRYWANFVRTGDPNKSPDGTRVEVSWPQNSQELNRHLILAPTSTTVTKSIREKYCDFWNTIWPLLFSPNIRATEL